MVRVVDLVVDFFMSRLSDLLLSDCVQKERPALAGRP